MSLAWSEFIQTVAATVVAFLVLGGVALFCKAEAATWKTKERE